MTGPIIIGTRGSALALAQAGEAVSALRFAHPDIEFEVRAIRTSGDRSPHVPLPGEPSLKGLFVREIEEALLRGEIRIAVHSMKDLPAEQPPGLMVAAVPKRADPFDVLLSRGGEGLTELDRDASVGTSSPRRAAQLLSLKPDIRIVPLRGNVETRIQKLGEGYCDAILLAAAGLDRLGLRGYKTERLTPPSFVPAPGQGALALEIREGDRESARLVAPLDHHASAAATRAERALMRRIGGGCGIPLGAYATPDEEGMLTLVACIHSPDGIRAWRGEAQGSVQDPEELGIRLAEKLILGSDLVNNL